MKPFDYFLIGYSTFILFWLIPCSVVTPEDTWASLWRKLTTPIGNRHRLPEARIVR